MSDILKTKFTRDQLFADLQKDGVQVSNETIQKARDGDESQVNVIGLEYYSKLERDDKAMAWYRLSAAQNHDCAQVNIAILYEDGLGVPQNYLTALEWYLKAAAQKDETAWEKIGEYFESGKGIPVDKHKALEWYYKFGDKSSKVTTLTQQGIRLPLKDKCKCIDELIVETEDIVWAVKKEEENKEREELKSLLESKTKMEEVLMAKIASLEEEVTSLKHSKASAEEESTTKIKQLEEEIKGFKAAAKDRQHEVDNQIENVEECAEENKTANNKKKKLKVTNEVQAIQLVMMESKIETLEAEITSSCSLSENQLQSMAKRIEEVERSNQNLERLLEQERRLKNNEIMLIRQEMVVFLNEEKIKKRRLEAESLAMEPELKRMKTKDADTRNSTVLDTTIKPDTVHHTDCRCY